MKFPDFFDRIAGDLDIERGQGEEDLFWRCRVVYSAAVKRGLDSLWDNEDTLAQDKPNIVTVSIEHVTRTIGKTLEAFYTFCPDLCPAMCPPNFLPNAKLLNAESALCELLQECGCFYHRNFQASPAVQTQAQLSGVKFLRGLPPGSSRMMSGAGMYTPCCNAIGSNAEVIRMFDLQKILSGTDLEHIEASSSEQVMVLDGGYEFLQLRPKFCSKYWKDKPDRGILSLMRRRQLPHVYFFYRYDGKHLHMRSLPQWRCEKRAYLSLSAALLAKDGALPPFHTRAEGEIVRIRVGYKLSPREECFFRLYSWPDFSTRGNAYFSRIMNKSVYDAFKMVMINLGYPFMESSYV